MSSPFPPDPGYSNSTSTFVPMSYVPRIKPEAIKTASLHQDGTIKQLLRTEVTEKPFKKSRINYIKENISRVRNVRARKDEKSTEKCSVMISTPDEPVKLKHSGPYSAMDKQHLSGDQTIKNFVLMNKKSAGVIPVRVLPVSSPKKSCCCKVGEVPKYLQQRKKLWLRQKLLEADLPDPTIPDGHTVMSTDDKINTLEVLQQNKRTLTSELLSLPLMCDTLKHKQRKIDLETRLSEIDDAIKIFSRPKVFIKV